MNKREYSIYSDTSWEALEKSVTAALNRGAECQGGVFVLIENGKRIYMQAIVEPA